MGMTLVAGASSGIGRSLARRIADAGEPVAVVARRKELLDSLVEEIQSAPGYSWSAVSPVKSWPA